MTRWKAAGIHMAIGLVLIATITGSIFYFWFPHALYRIAGMDRLLITMLCVDLVAGPALTCIVYKAGDRRTKWDLTVIGILQVAFLGYALYTAWNTRPVFLVWSVDRMSLIFANEIEPEDLAAGKMPESRTLPWFGPKLVAIVLPKDADERKKAFISIIKSGTTVERLPAWYGPYSSVRAEVLRNALPIKRGVGSNSKAHAQHESVITSTDTPINALRVAPIESSRDAGTMLIDGKTAMPLEVAPHAAFPPVEPNGS